MKVIGFVARDGVGNVQRGALFADDGSNSLVIGANKDISLNLSAADVLDYVRVEQDLTVVLADGRTIVLEGFFSNGALSRLFVSTDGDLTEVNLTEGENFGQYQKTEAWGKWSASDDLIFLGSDDAGLLIEPGNAGSGLGTLFGAGVSSSAGLVASAAGVGAATLATAAVLNRSGNNVPASVDAGGETIVVNAEEPDPSVTISGTAEPGSGVAVTIGEATLETIAGSDGTWSVVFEGEELPEDGDYTSDVVVTAPDTVETDVSGPEVIVDLTPPEVSVSTGTQSADDFVNGVDHADGVELSGEGEIGATVTVTVEGVSETVVVDDSGTWAVVFDPADIPTGEYETPVTVTIVDTSGNTSTVTDTLVVDTVAGIISIDAATVEGDGTVNATEITDGVVIDGISEPGSSIVVELEGETQVVTVDESGTWTVEFDPATLPAGEYDATVTATTTDIHGNTNSTTEVIRVDTVGSVAISADAIAGDNVINAVEAANGVTLTGTAEIGSTVEVRVGEVTRSATVLADGTWTVEFNVEDLPAGEYDADIVATATDVAGNVTTASGTVHIDTESMIALTGDIAGGDGLINAVEAANGITLTGTTQSGSSVEVTLGDVTRTASVDAAGNWTVDFLSSEIAEGTYDAAVTAVSTDAAGNIASVSGTLMVDTLSFVDISTATVEGDGVVNAAEAADGVTLTGATQPGSNVDVTLGDVSRPATVDAEGKWTVDFAAAEIAGGEYTQTVTATATDTAGNVSTSTSAIQIDTEVRNLALQSAPGGADVVVNAAEAAVGITLTGTTEIGSSVTLQLGNATTQATVDAAGNWTAYFAPSDIPAGEYSATLTATAIDRAGNQRVVTETVTIDTEASSLALGTAAIEGDNVVNAVELADGVVLTGTSEPGAIVDVTLAGVTKPVTTDHNGNWSASFSKTEVPSGTYDAAITAVTTDAAGNSRAVTGSVHIDTDVDNHALSSGAIETDGVINFTEASDGVVLNGTTEPGSTVNVTLGNVTRTATVAANGTWSANFAASEIPAGEYMSSITATATDAAGNTAVATGAVRVDTLVTNLGLSGTPIEGDNVINFAEAADGITLNGTTEIGSSVSVSFDGVHHSATVDAHGNWSVDFAASDIRSGEYTGAIAVTATDLAGNIDTVTSTVVVDTIAPGAPLMSAVHTGVIRGETGVRGISIQATDDAVDIVQLNGNGSTFDMGFSMSENTAFGELDFAFTTLVPDGSHLVVSTEDTSGNTSGTLFVLEEKTTSHVDLSNPGLIGQEIQSVDLQFAADSKLTITEAQLQSLSEATDTLTVHGDVDDTVTATGAINTGETRTVDGQSYSVYTLGDDGGSLIIDDEITVII